MAGGRPVRISILADSKEFTTAMDKAASSAKGFETAADKAATAAKTMDDRVDGIANGADTMASKGSIAGGALVGIGGTLALINPQLAGLGAGMMGAGTAMQFLGDAGDIVNVAMTTGKAAIDALKNSTLIQSIATKAAAAAQWVMNAAMAANPIMLVVLAIAALVAGLIWFFTQTEVGRKAWAAFTAFMTSAWAKVSTFMGRAWTAIVGFFTTAAATITKVWTTVSTWFSALPGRILKFFTSIPSKLGDIGRNIITGLWNGINDKVWWIRDKIAGFVNSVTGWFKNFFGIKSPSRLMADLGRQLPAGLAQGITAGAGLVTAAWGQVTDGFDVSTSLAMGGAGGVYIAPGAIVVQAGVGDPVEIGEQITKYIKAYAGVGGRK